VTEWIDTIGYADCKPPVVVVVPSALFTAHTADAIKLSSFVTSTVWIRHYEFTSTDANIKLVKELGTHSAA